MSCNQIAKKISQTSSVSR